MAILIGVIFGALIVAAILIPATLLKAYVIVKLWSWFLVPLGLFNIGYAHAIGISLIVGLLTKEYVPSKDGDKYGSISHTFLNPLLILLIGYIATSFM